MLNIDVRSNIRALTANLDRVTRQQMPFAMAKTLTNIGRLVQAQEKKNLQARLDRPTPFTVNSVGVKAARKNDLTAVVYVRDIAATYLAPFEFGGKHKMIGRGRTWLNPKNGVQLNQYGNLSRNKLNQLKGRSDVFVGKVETKSGQTIDGVWQRPKAAARKTARRPARASSQANASGRLRLLLRFGDAMPVRQHLGYRASAKAVVNAAMEPEWRRALAEAMRSAR